jgi:hypothetical protein
MALANMPDLPRSASTQFLRFMLVIFPEGETKSTPHGEFIFSPRGSSIKGMETAEETRRNRLRMLVKKFGSMADLCQALGYARNETATLTRILNANVRHERGGKPYNMGSPMAREIEEKLALAKGWMDTPPTYAELLDERDPRAKAMAVFESLPVDQWDTALRLLDALAQPAKKNGTNG